MMRRPTEEEIRLVLKLVGTSFEELEVVKEQLSKATISELDNGSILEFHTTSDVPLTTTKRVLGEGSLRDLDDTPIVFVLLQKDGFIWRLDISRASPGQFQRPLDYDSVVALGFGKGLSLASNGQS